MIILGYDRLRGCTCLFSFKYIILLTFLLVKIIFYTISCAFIHFTMTSFTIHLHGGMSSKGELMITVLHFFITLIIHAYCLFYFIFSILIYFNFFSLTTTLVLCTAFAVGVQMNPSQLLLYCLFLSLGKKALWPFCKGYALPCFCHVFLLLVFTVTVCLVFHHSLFVFCP